jgi:hypothetical protein
MNSIIMDGIEVQRFVQSKANLPSYSPGEIPYDPRIV